MVEGRGDFATTDMILRHPRFVAARDGYIDTLMSLHELRPTPLELMRDGGRIVVYGVIMALWGGYREAVPETWPSVRRLKSEVARFALASPRQIDLVLARFVQAGYLHVRAAPGDARWRLVLPTPGLIEHDRAFIRAHYTPLATMFGEEPYALPLAGDLAFLMAARAAWLATLGAMAEEVIRPNRPVLRFYAASGGMLMLMKLARLQSLAGGAAFTIDQTDLGRRFGVSRTHVRTLLQSAAADGHIVLEGPGRLRLAPALLDSLDLNIAERLSLLDRSRHRAMRELMVRDLEGAVAPTI
jgi:hypothetical protein